MNNAEARDVQVVLSYFLDPHSIVGNDQASAAIMRLAELAYKTRGGLEPSLVADWIVGPTVAEALGARPVEDVPVGDVL